jgi:GNAT superfamily N-acetyltransferase
MTDVRPISLSDHDHWLLLWQGYQRFYNTDIPATTTQTTWQRLLDANEPMHAAIAWQDERAVGLVHWIYHRSCWTVSNYCYLQDLFVDINLRGGGVGRALIESVYAHAQHEGASRVYWLTQEDNARARQLYDRIAQHSGFVQYRHLLGD